MILGTPRSTPLLLRRRYKHSPDRVFDAFAHARSLEQWFAPSPDIKTHATEFNFELGGRYRLVFALPSGGETSVSGEYIAIDRPRELRFTWLWEEPDPHAGISSLVTVNFVDLDGATELVLSHERLTCASMTERHSLGWAAILERLAHCLERTTTP